MPRLKPVYVHIIRIFLGVLFILSGIFKTVNLMAFKEAVENLQIHSEVIINLVICIIPSLELFCGIALLIGVYKIYAIFILNILMILFTSLKILMYIKDIDFQCNCFGPIRVFESISLFSISFNLILILLLFTQYPKKINFKIKSSKVKLVFIVTLFFSIVNYLLYDNSIQTIDIYKNKIVEITAVRALEIINENDGILIDARDERKYKKGTISDAMNIPYSSIKNNLHKMKNLSKSKPIIIFCDNST